MRGRKTLPPNRRAAPGPPSVSLAPYLWPKNAPGLRVRLVLASLAMLLAKVATVYVPILYSHAIDHLTPKAGPLMVPAAIIVAYALVRIAAAGFGELRDAIFAAVQMRASRVVARQTFEHLHGLAMRFHLDRQTGGLSNIILRGTLGIQNVLRMATFNMLPTIIELLLTVGVLWHLFNAWYAIITFARGRHVYGVHLHLHGLAHEIPPDHERDR